MTFSNETIYNDDNFIVKIHIPGIKKEDITLKLVDNFWKLVIISDTYFGDIKLELIKDLAHFDNTFRGFSLEDDYILITFQNKNKNNTQING